jgi:hypothetical protein
MPDTLNPSLAPRLDGRPELPTPTTPSFRLTVDIVLPTPSVAVAIRIVAQAFRSIMADLRATPVSARWRVVRRLTDPDRAPIGFVRLTRFDENGTYPGRTP